MKYALVVDSVSKSFRYYSSEWHRILSWFGFGIKPKEEKQILKHISFSITSGEAVGIIGQNGAGKSTLLKIITGTLKPSEGKVKINGRVSAILELGMGFHPDLTGRQNVYHSAGLMGFTHEQIDGVIDEIEEFAEIGDYFDQPVRLYSSGMQMRVAFSVATAYRPEILIIDEALSVGDAYFQHKSFGRIREYQEHGTTLLIVSHDTSAIQAICNRAILLESGSILKDGNPEEVMNYYNALIAEKENSNIEQNITKDGRVKTRSGTKEATISSVTLCNENGNPIEYVEVGQKVELQIEVQINQDIKELVQGYMIKDRLGLSIFGTNTWYLGHPLKDLKKGEKVSFSFHFSMNLGPGSYSVTVAAHSGHSHVIENYEWLDNALLFHVVNSSQSEFVGSTWLPPRLECSIGR